MINLVEKVKKLIPSPVKKALATPLNKISRLLRNRTVVKKIDGLVYKLDLRELIDYEIYRHGRFEPDTTRAIQKLTKTNMTILDIGANSGCHTIRFAGAVGPTGRVIAFEPMSWAFKKLSANISLNHFTNITTEKIALSDSNQSHAHVNFACSWPINLNQSELHSIHKGKIMSDTVPTSTLDSYLANNPLPKVDLIKLDVDGFELKILRGALNTLKKFKPVIITEISRYTLAEQNSQPEEMIDLLLSAGYQLCRESDFQPFPEPEALLNSIPAKKTINIIAFPKKTS